VCEVILQSVGVEMTKPQKKREPASGFDPAALDALLGERRTLGRSMSCSGR
jgi:hypothetical protein